MNQAVLAFLPEAIEALVGLFRSLRSAREAESVISYLRELGPVHEADIDSAVRRAVDSSARHSDGTGASD